MKGLWTGGSLIEPGNSSSKSESSQKFSASQFALTSSPVHDMSLKSNGGESSRDRNESTLLKRSARNFSGETGSNLDDQVVSAEEINLDMGNRTVESHRVLIDLERSPYALLDQLRSATPTKIKRSRFRSIERDLKNGDETQTGSPIRHSNLFDPK